MALSLVPVSFDQLAGWQQDDPTPIIEGLMDCGRHVASVKAYKTGSMGLTCADLAPAYGSAADECPRSACEARRFFESHFQPFQIRTAEEKAGFVTAYYEPELEVSSRRSARFCHPIYKRPHDLIALDDTNRPAGFDASLAFGWKTDGGIKEYPDRRAIDQGFLDGRGLEIAWAASRADVFFMHIQGSARLCFEDGSMRRVTYAAKTGHPFTAIGRVLIDWGEQHPDRVTMQSLRRWLMDHPDRVDALLWRNRSYIFFREASVDDPDRGPVAAAKVPLIPGRSLAVDRFIHTFGMPVFIDAEKLIHLSDQPFRRLMLAQDTGSAIVGPARGDIFTGSGSHAGELAGRVKHEATFYALVPNAAAGRFSQ
ncbi:MAG: murein transglycosylase A [Alphaproteobacteria bacterium]|nr:murein transglycosylase A [Alphaproteobacteria bacterium]